MTQTPLLQIVDLHARVEGREILKGLSLTLERGSVTAIMGRNGSGKTTLAHAIMGNPHVEITHGNVMLDGEDITRLPTDERARKRLFLAFQNPIAIPGVTIANFLRASLKAVRGHEIPVKEFRTKIRAELARLGIPEAFMTRFLNDGFSGGERKRLETLQLRLLEPKVAVLDETDSGLDIDALKVVAENINSLRSPDRALLVITHYQRLLHFVKPDRVLVLLDGEIVREGGAELAFELEERGYDWISHPETKSEARV